MAAKKRYYKRKLLEKQTQIILEMIDEEIDLAIQEYLSEQYDGDYGGGGYGAVAGDSASHGLGQLTDRNRFTGMLLSPVSDIWNAVKIAGAKATVQLVGMAALLVGGTIAGLLPFNDPRTVDYIAKKIRFVEQENLKLIDKQFEKELGQMRDGWETFKTDFWGLGFVASPLSAIAAISTIGKGTDMGMSVLNVVTGGWAEKQLEKVTKDIEDPGSLKDFIHHGKEKDEDAAEDHVRKAIEQDRCFSNLKSKGWMDPECYGITQRDKFPSGPAGTDSYIKFVVGNVDRVNDLRKERFRNVGGGSGGEYENVWADPSWSSDTRSSIVNWLRQNKYITETYIPEGVVSTIASKLTTGRKKTGVPALEALHTKIDGWKKQGKITPEEEQEFFRKALNNMLSDPGASGAAAKWSAANTAKMVGNMFQQVSTDIVSGKAGRVTPQEMAAYKAKTKSMVDGMLTAAQKSTKKFKVTPLPGVEAAAVQAAAQAVQASSTPQPQPVQPQPTK